MDVPCLQEGGILLHIPGKISTYEIHHHLPWILCLNPPRKAACLDKGHSTAGRGERVLIRLERRQVSTLALVSCYCQDVFWGPFYIRWRFSGLSASTV